MKRNNVQNVQFHENLNAIKGGNKKFDIVVLDVPCTGISNQGSGRMKKSPEMKLLFEENYLNKFLLTQMNILEKTKQFVKDGRWSNG